MESQILSINYLKAQPRWDFRYFDPKYLEVERLLREGKYPLEPLEKFARQIQNFGAYSLCNLLKWVDNKDSIPYLRITNLKEDGIDWTDVLRIELEVHEKLPKSKVYSGDVLYSMAGTIGLSILAPDDLGECNSNQAIAKIRLQQNTLNPNYLVAFLNSRLGKYQSERIANGQTVLNINLGEIGKLLIPTPPRPIQDQIAQVMQEAYDNRLKKTKEADILLEGIDSFVLGKLGIDLVQVNRQKSFLVPISQLIGQRFDVESVSNRFSVQDYPHVSWTTLNKIASLPTNTKIPSRHPEQTFTYIGMTDVDNIYGEVNSQNLLGKNIKANKIVIQGNDLVFARIEPCVYNLKIALIPENIDEALGSTELLIARSKSDVIPEFLLWILRSELIQRQIAGKVTGTTGRRRLPNSIFASLKIPQISLELQKSIADEAMQRRDRAKQLKLEAEAIVSAAKVRVEKMILGEEVADGE